MKRVLSVLFVLVLAVSLTLVPAVVSANPAGDITIVVLDQAGGPIEGAQARIFWGDPAWAWMPPKITQADGSITFTAADITSWRSDNSNPTMFQVAAINSNDEYYGNVYTWAVSNEAPCITYDSGTDYTFTYNLVMFKKQAPTVEWGTEAVTVTYNLYEAPTVPVTEKKIGFFHGPLDAATTPIFQAYPKEGSGWDFYDMIDTNEDGSITVDDYVDATVDGTSMSVTTWLKYFAGITDHIIAVPFLVKTPVDHNGLTADEKEAAEDMYGFNSSVTVGLMTITTEAVKMTADVRAPIISISVSPLSIDFGKLRAGQSSDAKTITVINTGEVDEDIDATVENESRADFYKNNLTLDTVSVGTWGILGLGHGVSQDVSAVLTVPEGTTMGTLTATLVFWAEAP